MKENNTTAKRKGILSNPFLILIIMILCPPLGIMLMWFYKKFFKIVRIALTAFFGLYIIACIGLGDYLAAVSPCFGVNSSYVDAKSEQSKSLTDEESQTSKSIEEVVIHKTETDGKVSYDTIDDLLLDYGLKFTNAYGLVETNKDELPKHNIFLIDTDNKKLLTYYSNTTKEKKLGNNNYDGFYNRSRKNYITYTQKRFNIEVENIDYDGKEWVVNSIAGDYYSKKYWITKDNIGNEILNTLIYGKEKTYNELELTTCLNEIFETVNGKRTKEELDKWFSASK